MVFSSLTFLCLFLPCTFALYQLMPSLAAKNVLLVAASLVFYAYGEPIYIALMLASTLANWAFGLKVTGNRPVLVAAVVLNLALLGVFKYAGMAVETVNAIAGLALPMPQIALPLGISFYTFQALSYVIDVYRGECTPQRSYLRVLLYICLFPQLVAGPIVKYHDIDEQIGGRQASIDDVALGLRRFCVGLAKKVLIANTMASAADALFGLSPSLISAPVAWVAAISYLMQIYFDFSAYSDMAIGLGAMFGFRFLENFDYPYVSTSIKEFWRRWHISLSTWFKEYVYIPLGGNRRGRLRAGFNKAIVFFLCGLWHGANWTFVVWGLVHGTFSLLEEVLPVRRLPKLAGHAYVLLIVTLSFVIFRCETIAQAASYLAAMLTGWNASRASIIAVASELTPLYLTALVAACIGASGLPKRLFDSATQRSEGTYAASLAGSFCLLLLCLVALSSGTYNPFIYFRF